jgi:DNA polymerase-3 subunit alpha
MVDDYKGAKELVEFYAKTFKDRYYLELQPHPIDDQRKHNAAIMDLAQSMGVPLVGTTDCHYLNKDDHFAQEVLMCISTGKTILDPDRLRHEGFTLHLKTEQEMVKEFEHNDRCAEAVRNSALIASQCDLSLESKTYYMPKYECADERPLIDIMAEMAREGLTSREDALSALPGWGPAMKQQYLDRVEEEISLIGKMGFAGYFLVVADFIVWAKDHGIPVGPAVVRWLDRLWRTPCESRRSIRSQTNYSSSDSSIQNVSACLISTWTSVFTGVSTSSST